MSEKNGALGTSLLIFTAGALLGAVVTALTTPKSGPELRGDLKDMGIRMKDRLARLRNADHEHAQA